MKTSIFVAALIVAPTFAGALEIQPVTDQVWALVGENQQRNVGNLANNATFGVVVTDAGIVLMDSGGSWHGAAAIDAAIDKFSDQQVKYVINTGGQDHRWIANSYWQAQGATVIASAAAVEDQKSRGDLQMSGLKIFLGNALEGTRPSYADIIFDETYSLEFGGLDFEIIHSGAAHTPGDSYVWLAQKDTVFTGDIVYVERILGVGSQSDAKSWIGVFEAMAALDPAHVVPGHGAATTLKTARADTYDYLVNLRARMGEYIDDGGDIIGSVDVDQAAFSYLQQFESLARRNAQTVFEQMEWE